jgi:hypothetical protein
MTLYLNISPARKRFKDLLGGANHLLITILVGLDAVDKGLVKNGPTELHAAWNPQDVKASVSRSKILVREMALVRAIDALDAYISWVRRKPALIQEKNLASQIDGAGHSVMAKFLESGPINLLRIS